MAGETGITVIGNLTADPEVRTTQGGHTVANFTIASTPRTFDRQRNEWVDGEALFLRCTAWRELGEHVAASLQKGARVIAQGNLGQQSWNDKATGEKRTGYQLDVQAIGPELRYATASVQRASRNDGQQRASNGTPQDAWATPGSYDDDTPF